jgi:hypothetical protein
MKRDLSESEDSLLFQEFLPKRTFFRMQGPLAWAIIVWRCSLVFSSLDKIVSVLIHLLPGRDVVLGTPLE